MRTILVMIIVAVALGCHAAQNEFKNPIPLAQTKWQHRKYPVSRLELEVPEWASVINEGKGMWLLLALPLTKNPVAGDQFGISVLIHEYPLNIHRISFPPAAAGTHTANSINAAHWQTVTIRTDYRVYVIRDLFTEEGSVLRYVAQLSKELSGLDDYISDVTRIAESLKVKSENQKEVNTTSQPKHGED